MQIANIAPIWIAISKTLFLIDSNSIKYEEMIRWAVEETGINSVRPSIIPRIIALINEDNSSTKEIIEKLM